VLYALGRWGGRPLVLRYGGLLRIDERGLDRAERWFRRYRDGVVLVCRLIPLARSVVSVPAGTMRMPYLRFTALTLLGTATWNVALIGTGRLLGENWGAVSRWAGAYSDAAVLLLGIAVFAYAAYRVLHAPRRRRIG
jgi:membrane protein DedA with SNARE-associated domain